MTHLTTLVLRSEDTVRLLRLAGGEPYLELRCAAASGTLQIHLEPRHLDELVAQVTRGDIRLVKGGA